MGAEGERQYVMYADDHAINRRLVQKKLTRAGGIGDDDEKVGLILAEHGDMAREMLQEYAGQIIAAGLDNTMRPGPLGTELVPLANELKIPVAVFTDDLVQEGDFEGEGKIFIKPDELNGLIDWFSEKVEAALAEQVDPALDSDKES